MKFLPLADRVMIKRVDAPGRTAGGLYIPESGKEKPMEAIVVAVGDHGGIRPDGTVEPMPLAEGDKVLVGKYGGMEIELDSTAYLVVRIDEILGKLTEDDEDIPF